MKLITIAILAITLTSCGVHLGADGSKDVTIDAPAALTVLRILAEK